LFASALFAQAQIPRGARVVIAPMGGFETYFAAAVREKKVPITLTLDKESAPYFLVSSETEWQGFVAASGASANWNQNGGNFAGGSAASSSRGLEASIMLIDAKTKDVLWAYEVHKSSHGALLLGTHGARGQQSLAEACAKHLKQYIEKAPAVSPVSGPATQTVQPPAVTPKVVDVQPYTVDSSTPYLIPNASGVRVGPIPSSTQLATVTIKLDQGTYSAIFKGKLLTLSDYTQNPHRKCKGDICAPG
jgi:hypothetical protein